MKLNIKSKIIQSKYYITSDGSLLDEYYDAEYYEKGCMYEKLEKEYEEIIIPIVNGSIFKIKNYERLELLKFYYDEVLKYIWRTDDDFKNAKYPCYVIYDDRGNVYLISNTLGEELYKWYDENKDNTIKV